MECILCNRDTAEAAAVCDGCAAEQLRDDWYVDESAFEGPRRLLRMTDVVAVLDGNGYSVTLAGLDVAGKFGSFPENEEGYLAACVLFNEMMKELGQPPDGSEFTPPPFGMVRDAIRRLDYLETVVEGKGIPETYLRLANLYTSAASHFKIPYVSDAFASSRKQRLTDRAAYWQSKILAETVQVEEPQAAADAEAVEEVRDEPAPAQQEAEAGAAADVVLSQPEQLEVPKEPLEPKVEQLKKRIAEIEEGMKAPSEAKADEPAPPVQEDGGQPQFIRNARKRAYLHYLSFGFETAFSEMMKIIEGGMGTEHDYVLASVLSLRTARYTALKDLQESAAGKSIDFDTNLLRAVIDWKQGIWGRALQLAQREMKKGSYSAGFLLKKSICEQYNMREKYKELEEEKKKVTDLQKGADLLSSIYLSIDTWGAAMQIMAQTDRAEWTAESWTNMGMALEEKGDVKGALESYEKALELNPLLLPAIVREGLLQCKMGKHELAFETLRLAGSLEPSILRLQAAELVEIGRKEEALVLLESLLERDEDDAEAASLGLRLSRELGRIDKERTFKLYAQRGVKHGDQE